MFMKPVLCDNLYFVTGNIIMEELVEESLCQIL